MYGLCDHMGAMAPSAFFWEKANMFVNPYKKMWTCFHIKTSRGLGVREALQSAPSFSAAAAAVNIPHCSHVVFTRAKYAAEVEVKIFT